MLESEDYINTLNILKEIHSEFLSTFKEIVALKIKPDSEFSEKEKEEIEEIAEKLSKTLISKFTGPEDSSTESINKVIQMNDYLNPDEPSEEEVEE